MVIFQMYKKYVRTQRTESSVVDLISRQSFGKSMRTHSYFTKTPKLKLLALQYRMTNTFSLVRSSQLWISGRLRRKSLSLDIRVRRQTISLRKIIGSLPSKVFGIQIWSRLEASTLLSICSESTKRSDLQI
jgi:hypothetical protein